MMRRNLLAALAPMLVGATMPVEAPRPAPREPIGTVLGAPIYRDELRAAFPLRDELFRLIGPALQKYREEHRELIEPTDAELTFATEFFRREHPDKWRKRDAEWKEDLAEIEQLLTEPNLSPDERKRLDIRKSFLTRTDPVGFFARFLLDSRKFNRHLYRTFDGGRIVWQQGGVEAFDAHRRWLEMLEARGDFSFTDPKLRAVFYEYWTNERKHGSFLSTPEKDPQAFEEFLNPPWFPAEPAR